MQYPADESIVSVCLVPNSSRQQHSVDPVSPRSATILYQTSYVGERGVRNKALLLHLYRQYKYHNAPIQTLNCPLEIGPTGGTRIPQTIT